MTNPPDATDLFTSGVAHYARYRSGYPQQQLDALCARIGLERHDGALDIGCGTGQATLPLARRAGWVVAVDPVAEMLAEGRRSAHAAGIDNISWRQGDASRLAELVEPGAKLAMFAASFHWTERDAVLHTLDGLLAPDGSVVVVHDDLDEDEQPDWAKAITDVRGRYPGLAPRPGAIGTMPVAHRDVLERSAFRRVRASTWSWTRTLDIEQVVGLQLTYSFSSPALLGERVEDFCAEVREVVRELHPDGIVSEPYRVEVLTGSRET